MKYKIFVQVIEILSINPQALHPRRSQINN